MADTNENTNATPIANDPKDSNQETENKPTLEELQKQLNAEKERSKRLKLQVDDYSSQIAEHKKKEKEKMTDDELKAQEQAEKDNKFNEMAIKLAKMEASNVFANKGFKSEEYQPIVEKLFGNGSVDVQLCTELSEEITTLIENRVKTAKELMTNDMLANNTKHPNQQHSDEEESEYQRYKKQKEGNIAKKIVKLN